ncbi:MAG: hypothetical protein VYE15_05045, partial [Myxococcota bacterium]|nr:hypothetical protein [Myxococcota bacterium]
EAGKRGAAATLELQARVLEALTSGTEGTAAEWAQQVEAPADQIFHILRRLSATGRAQERGSGLGRIFSGSEPP